VIRYPKTKEVSTLFTVRFGKHLQPLCFSLLRGKQESLGTSMWQL